MSILRRGTAPPLINTNWNTPGKAADMLCMPALQDWVYDNRNIQPLDVTKEATSAHVTTVIKLNNKGRLGGSVG